MLIGLDIGGTKVEGVIVSSYDGQVLHRLRVDTPKTNYVDFLLVVKNLITALMGKEQVRSIGVGCCGSINRVTGKIQGANLLYLNDEDFLTDLRSSYSIPVAFTNDANCLAISEFKSGAAKDASNSCLAVILGTGCGSGIVIHGDIVDGQHGLGGEIGHNPLPSFDPDIDGPSFQCYCGSYNCNETFVSGTGFERTWAIKHPPQSAKEIFASYAMGDKNAIAHVEYYADCLARILGTIVNVIDPEVIVLGGGVSNQDGIYPLVQERLASYTFSKSVSTPVRKALHGDSSGVLGAAYLPVIKGMI